MKFHESCGAYNCHAVFSISVENVDGKIEEKMIEEALKQLNIWRETHMGYHAVNMSAVDQFKERGQ